MLNYSIHTYELYARLTLREYPMVYQAQKELKPSIEHKSLSYSQIKYKEDSFIFRKFPTHGINYIKLCCTKCDGVMLNWRLYIVVNPYNALNDCAQSDKNIIMPCQINTAYEKINNSLTDILPPTIVNYLTLRRVDFCVNLPFPSQSQAEKYIHLLRLGVPPKVLTEKRIYDEIQRREIPYKDSLLLECVSYSFEIYSKYVQMKNRKLQNPEYASGIVRIELRAGKQKLLQLAKKYELCSPESDYHTFLIHTPYIARQEITEILCKMVGSKDFHSYSYVKEKFYNLISAIYISHVC